MAENYKTPPDRTLVLKSRPHDFLYDPNYIMPSRENFIRNATFGTMSGSRVVLRPVYESFFSDIKKDRRINPCLTIPQPNNLDSFLPYYEIDGVPVMPMDTGPLPRLVDDVTGADRAKYGIKYTPPTYHMHQENFDFNKLPPKEKKKLLQTQKTKRSGYINRGTQTDKRESETQTDPYSPPYKLPHPGAYPKVLSLLKLTWGKGLPFTLEDIVVIERALSRRLVERTDQIMENDKAFENRIKLMEELEAQHWADREKELEEILSLKMEITAKLLNDYNMKITTDHTLKLERLQSTLKLRNTKLLERIKHEYFRSLRKLERKYVDKPSSKKRNIIKDYVEFDSAIYAPLTRNGLSLDQLTLVPSFQFDLHRDFEGFKSLTESKCFIKNEISFDMKEFKNRIEKCGPSGAEKRLDRKLEKIFSALKDWNLPKRTNALSELEARKEFDPRLSAPLITLDAESEEKQRRPHCIILQKVARGRVIQQLIRREMEENMNELLLMKQMFDMDPNCLRLEEGQMQKLLAMKKQSEADSSKGTEVKEVLGHLEGETLNKMVDFLDKEMIRIIDERKLHALFLMADRERRRKEATEGGKRYHEEQLRRLHDEVFKHITGIHQGTVDMYLEDIFIEACDRVADEESRIHARQIANALNEAAYSTVEVGELGRDELAAELVSNFMIPELHRRGHYDKLDNARTRYKKAALQVLEAVFGAHGVVRHIATGPVPALLEEHNLTGMSVADGSLTAVDNFIKEAVDKVLKTRDDEVAMRAALGEAAMAEEAFRNAQSEEDEMAALNFVKPDFDQDARVFSEVGGMDEDYKLEGTGIPDIQENAELFFDDPTISLQGDMVGRLAAKALQVDLHTEPSGAIEAIYLGLRRAVDGIISAARKEVVGQDPTSEKTSSLQEDTDDD